MISPAPPIVQLAERILRDVELAVSVWIQRHKYTHGTRLRDHAFVVAQCAHRAWRDKGERAQRIQALAHAVDDLKLSLQLGQQIKAFASFAQFEGIARTANELGKQVGGWQRQQQQSEQHRKGQNASTPQSAPQRAQILSPQAASHHTEALR